MEQTTLNNRYLLEKKLGIGGMAMVYRARDLMLERTVAIKTLRDDFSNDPEFQERFRQEARSAAKLSHINIVTVHDFGLSDQTLYIVMEYVPGSDLKTAIKQAGQMDVDETVGLMIQACAGLGYAHRAGVIHCDIKPQNLLITPDNKLKIVDFGIARALATIQPDETTKIVWGSPNYFSPEQAAGRPPLPASDVYSLGVVLFEMLTGRLPFFADSAEELARKHRESLPPTPRRYNHSIPHRLEMIILKAMTKNPEERYQNADAMGKAIQDFYSEYQQQIISDVDPVKNLPPSSIPVLSSYPENASPPPQPNISFPNAAGQPSSEYNTKTETDNFEIDWITWLLALLALVFLGGLIPFWLWVYYQINPPI